MGLDDDHWSQQSGHHPLDMQYLLRLDMVKLYCFLYDESRRLFADIQFSRNSKVFATSKLNFEFHLPKEIKTKDLCRFQLNLELDLLLIDDNSPDKTWKLIQEYSKNKKNIHLIIRNKKEGLDTAHKTAYEYGVSNNYEFLIKDGGFNQVIRDSASKFFIK